MELERKIKALSAFGKVLKQNLNSEEYAEKFELATHKNPWFTMQSIETAFHAIAGNFLEEGKLREWTGRYDLSGSGGKTVGLILAGNIPLVGFHDLLAVLITGHKAMVKLSSKDDVLLPFLLEELYDLEPEFRNHIKIVEKLQDFDAVIATGSNNSARYFEYYFGKYPHIIRKNRNSVAVLTRKETPEEIHELGKDIFTHFGLGCRNVSKIYMPHDMDVAKFYEPIQDYSFVGNNNKYANNYNFHKSLMLINKVPHFDNGFLMLKENEMLPAPVSLLNYERYNSLDEVKADLAGRNETIQCIVSSAPVAEKVIPFGKTQQPELWDYADEVDTVQFLVGLN
jgi:hypothetical protein